MKIQNNKKMEMAKSQTKNFILLPSPSMITYSWNMGSILLFALTIQILTGILLSMMYMPDISKAFYLYMMSQRKNQFNFFVKNSHTLGASMMFAFIYTHIFKAMMNNSNKNTKTFNSGVMILTMLMASAFLGYTLPWGQMSLWGATVITNLLSTIPLMGEKITKWIWGSNEISQPTLNRFFSLHFMLPIILMAMSIVHMNFLHEKGSSSNLNINTNMDKIKFKLFFMSKDLLPISILTLISSSIVSSTPFITSDSENFNPANPLLTPSNIKPEWYFLFAYAILRSIPNKLGGVIALAMSILILFLSKKKKKSSKFNPQNKLKNSIISSSFILLTMTGSKSSTFNLKLSSMFTKIYFISMLM